MYLDCTFMPSKDDRTLFADLIYTLQYNKSQFRSKSKIEKKTTSITYQKYCLNLDCLLLTNL